jgi:hypothetical protein
MKRIKKTIGWFFGISGYLLVFPEILGELVCWAVDAHPFLLDYLQILCWVGYMLGLGTGSLT